MANQQRPLPPTPGSAVKNGKNQDGKHIAFEG